MSDLRVSVLCMAVYPLLAWFTISVASAEEPEDPDAKERASAQRLELMHELVHQFSAVPLDEDDDGDLELQSEPIMRYNDPARGLMDSTVWRLGQKGRPHALIAVELIKRDEQYLASYEFLAVETPRYIGEFRRFVWEPPDGVAEFQEIPNAPTPAKTKRGRLTQMKQMARRFKAHQQLGETNYNLRMLPQPVHRYQPTDAADADAAAFAFTYGVNPEVLMLIETDGTKWTFACLRLSVARLTVDLDGEPAWSANPTGRREFQNPNEVYTQARQYVPIPNAEIN